MTTAEIQAASRKQGRDLRDLIDTDEKAAKLALMADAWCLLGEGALNVQMMALLAMNEHERAMLFQLAGRQAAEILLARVAKIEADGN